MTDRTNRKPKKEELAAWVGQELASADGAEQGEHVENFKQAMRYYLNRPRGDEEEGSSAAQSSDVADMVGAVLANMLPGFAGDSVVKFEAMGPDDAEQAELESDAISQAFMEDNRGYVVLSEAALDALILKNGIIKCWVEEREDTTRQRYEGLNELEVAQALEGDAQTRVELVDSVDGDGGTDLTVRYTRRTELLRVAAVPRENFKLEQNYNSVFFDDVRFCAERHVKTRSELLEMGADYASVYAMNPMTPHDEAHTLRNLRQKSEEETAHQAAQERIELYECYYRVDMTGDGVTELVRVWAQGSSWENLLTFDGEYAEPVDFVPYAAGTCILQAHRFDGLSMYDREKQVQDSKTDAIRAWLNNAQNNNNARATVVENQVNMDDATSSRASGLVRVKAPGMYEPIPVQDIGPSISLLLGYLDKQRAERGGAALDLAGGESQLIQGANAGNAGIDRIYASKEQAAGLMCMTLAETLIRSTYLLIHRTMRTELTQPLLLQKAGQWQETNPAEWPERTRINVKVGLSPQERARRQSNLTQILQAQLQMLQIAGPGVMVGLDNLHATLIDWARASGIDAPEQYWVDPSSPDSQQAAQANAQAQQQAQQQAEAQQQQMVALQAQLAQAELQQKQIEAEQELRYKYFDSTLKSEIEEAKLTEQAMNGQLQTMQREGRARAGDAGEGAGDV